MQIFILKDKNINEWFTTYFAYSKGSTVACTLIQKISRIFDDSGEILEANKKRIPKKPLYSKLHGHVRYVLDDKYEKSEPRHGTHPIPAHLLGNMWAQKWGNIYSLVEPYPGAGERPDATPELQKLSILEMYQYSDEFYQSLDTW